MRTKENISPVEKLEEEIKVKELKNKIRKIFSAYIGREGPYNYALLSKEIESKSDEYCLKTYNLSTKEVVEILHSLFGEEYAYQETIDGFLENVRKIPNYAIRKVEK